MSTQLLDSGRAVWGLRQNMPPNEFGKLLKDIRKQKGETQESLAVKSGVTYVAVGDWERGKRNPRKENVFSLAQALGVEPADLLAAAGFSDEQDLTRVKIGELRGKPVYALYPSDATEEELREVKRVGKIVLADEI